MTRTFDWLKSWGMLEQTASPLDLVNADVQSFAHIAAEYGGRDLSQGGNAKRAHPLWPCGQPRAAL